MDNSLVKQLLSETIDLAKEDGMTDSMINFKTFVGDMLPMDVVLRLQEIFDDDNFLEEIWKDKFDVSSEVTEETSEEVLLPGQCLICERHTRLTRHHVFPRETHSKLVKRGYDSKLLNTTIGICRMCHNAVHRFFTNDELSESFYSVDLLLSDSRFLKYAKWASTQ
jgi:hypothetical protein